MAAHRENNLSYTDRRRTDLRANVVNPEYSHPTATHPQLCFTHGWNPVTAWPLLLTLQVVAVPVPIRSSRVISTKKAWNLRSDDLSIAWNYPTLQLSASFRTAWDHFSRTAIWWLLLTAVPVLQRQKSRMCSTAVTFSSVLQTREFTTRRALWLYICYITDKGMLVKEITQYRDHSIWILDAPIRQIYIEARHYTLNFTRIQCVKRNIWYLTTNLSSPVDRDNVVILVC